MQTVQSLRGEEGLRPVRRVRPKEGLRRVQSVRPMRPKEGLRRVQPMRPVRAEEKELRRVNTRRRFHPTWTSALRAF